MLHVLVKVWPLHPGSVHSQNIWGPSTTGVSARHAMGSKRGGRTSRAGGAVFLLDLHGGGPGDAAEDHP